MSKRVSLFSGALSSVLWSGRRTPKPNWEILAEEGTSAVRGILSAMAAIFAQKRVTLATKLVAVEMVEETIIFMAMEATVQDMVAEEEQTAVDMAGIRNFSQLTDLEALITATGFVINEEKSRTAPTQLIEFLGLLVDTKEMTFSLPILKRHFLIALCEKLLSSKLVLLRDLAPLLGNFSWSSSSVPYAQSHYRGVQSLYISKFKFLKGIMKSKLELNEETRNDLQWWVSNLLAAKCRAIYDPSPILVIYSDASLSGWGAECNGISTGGPWTPIDQGKHINDLELKAAFFALRCFTEFNRDCTIALKLDNSTAVCYVNRLGGSRSKSLNSIVLSIVKCCRSRVEKETRVRRLEIITGNVLKDSSEMDPASRPIRSLMERPAACLRELASTAGSLGDERLQPDLERAQGLCFPPFSLIKDCLSKVRQEKAELVLVGPYWPSQVCFPSGRASSAMPDEVIPADRLEIIRGRLRKQVIPERVIPLVLSGSRPTTLAAYQSAWIHWKNWCVKFGHNPELNNICNILLFFTEALEAGKAFSTINIYRSMLSVTLQPIEGHAVGKHPYVIALMRGIYNVKPPTPKNSETWEVEVVLNHLKSSQNIGLKLGPLSRRLATLLALATLLRVSELASIAKDSIKFTDASVSFFLSKPRKAQHDGALHVISVKRLPDISIDPVACLNHYISVTAPMRNNSNSSKLFVGSVKPHKPVGGSTISGWIIKQLSEAGINVSKFSAHSTRGAATSKAAAAGHPIQSILNASHWASQSIFTKYYCREVETLPTQERDRQRRGDRRQEGDRNDDSDEPTGEIPPQRKFAVPKRRMRVVRDWMTSTLSPSEAKQLRERFLPSFTDTDFDLKCPQVNFSLARRFKDLKCPEMSKAEATEKSLKAEQYKVLDVARPLLYLKEQMAEGELQNSPTAEAVDVALRLWGHTFYGITASHRENLLKVSDPKFVSLLKEPERFKTKQCGALFGSHFIKEMVKEATNDQKLRSIGRPVGQPSSFKSRYPGPSYNPTSASGYHRSGYNGGNRGGNFSGGRNSTEVFRNNKQKSSQRLRFFVHFWHSISNDPWIIQSLSEGVKIDFVSPPFQSHYQSNMLMGKDQLEICEQEIKSLLEKRAIEPIEPGRGFVSGLFVIPKRIPLLQELIHPGDFLTKIDLEDAYLTLPLRKEDRKFVQIKWGEMLVKDLEGSSGCASADAGLASTTVVFNDNGVDIPTAPYPETSGEPTYGFGREPSSVVGSWVDADGRLGLIRQRLEKKGLSSKVVHLLLAGNRETTSTAYQSCWNGWISWCTERVQDPVSPALGTVLEFLSDLHGKGLAYRSINVYRSMLSGTLEKMESYDVGKHPLVLKLMQGIFNSTPPKPKYTGFWDVGIVLRHIESLGSDIDLSLTSLSQKLVILREVRLIEFLKKPTQAERYVNMTQSFRGSRRPSSLMLGTKLPHAPIGASSIARWIKLVLADAGVDEPIYSAHSTRGAAASKAKASGMPIETILRTGSWETESVFSTHYNKSIVTESFQNVVLGAE
ncbi:Uncharacterized protein APZ42_018153 [Daphnia magna]|uniref:Tyr recombinase domain-containing protein n=1 Tax=Daphnia magna TaxID=35525 RepID=A0A162CI62_9CRUS|nr:Uncharacterized protein APZ42_018153 [Daphnia magna]